MSSFKNPQSVFASPRVQRGERIAELVKKHDLFYYISWGYLMEIVENINLNKYGTGGIDITYDVLASVNFKHKNFYYNEHPEYNMLDAVQDAIIFYFENLEKENE